MASPRTLRDALIQRLPELRRRIEPEQMGLAGGGQDLSRWSSHNAACEEQVLAGLQGVVVKSHAVASCPSGVSRCTSPSGSVGFSPVTLALRGEGKLHGVWKFNIPPPISEEASSPQWQLATTEEPMANREE